MVSMSLYMLSPATIISCLVYNCYKLTNTYQNPLSVTSLPPSKQTPMYSIEESWPSFEGPNIAKSFMKKHASQLGSTPFPAEFHALSQTWTLNITKQTCLQDPKWEMDLKNTRGSKICRKHHFKTTCLLKYELWIIMVGLLNENPFFSIKIPIHLG